MSARFCYAKLAVTGATVLIDFVCDMQYLLGLGLPFIVRYGFSDGLRLFMVVDDVVSSS
jgi:hypothetical protein